MKSVVLGVGGLLLMACPRPSPVPPDGGCPLASGTEQEFWKSLALVYQQCLLSHSTAECRSNTEQLEWFPVLPSTAITQELHGTLAPGGSLYPSPERAPEGDLCLSHDDIDWNFNVLPDPGEDALVQPGNEVPDVDHPDSGVIEAEWELMYVDPSFVAKPPDAGASYTTWPQPRIDMQVGDRVALRGAGVFDCGHAPYRGELHPPYLAVWGGMRDAGIVVHVRATALATRPADARTLPQPPDPTEALTSYFVLPPAPDGGPWVLSVANSIDWFLDAPSVVVDQGCNLVNGVDINGLQGPALNTALASPAAHLAAANQPSLAAAFFTLTADQVGSAMQVTVTPVDRSHQAVLGATLTAGWVCASDAGC